MESIEQIKYIKAPIATVYKALSSEEGFGEAWTRKLNVKPEISFVNVFYFDENVTKLKITEPKENSKVVSNCLESNEDWIGTGISFELTKKDNITTVILKHFDWKAQTDFYRWCNYNWVMFLFRIKSYCENQKEFPYQDREF